MTFKHYADLYLKFGKTEWKLSTYCKNKGIVKNRLNVFFDYDIDKINASMIKEFICSIDDVGLKSKKHYISSLSSIFKLALDDEVINKNPLIHIKTIKSPKKEIEPFNADEVHAILNLAKLHQSLNFYLFLSIGFFTGMRTGEILALKLKDINLNNGVIYVNATRSRFGESSPKTELSRRVVPIIDDLEPILIKAFKSFKFRSSDDYALLNSNLKPYRDTEIFTKRFKTILACLNIKYRRLYTMRHTYATNMLRANLVSPLELSYLLGHSTPKMIYDVYVKYINKNLDSFNRSIKIYN